MQLKDHHFRHQQRLRRRSHNSPSSARTFYENSTKENKMKINRCNLWKLIFIRFFVSHFVMGTNENRSNSSNNNHNNVQERAALMRRWKCDAISVIIVLNNVKGMMNRQHETMLKSKFIIWLCLFILYIDALRSTQLDLILSPGNHFVLHASTRTMHSLHLKTVDDYSVSC